MTAAARIEIAIMSRAWRKQDRATLAAIRRAARAALRIARPRLARCGVSFALMSDRQIRRLNRRYRGQDKATNVLSFPAFAAEHLPRAATRARGEAIPGDVMLGDVALAYETLAREAKAEHKTLRAHCTHLVIHGVLHLLGYDHLKERDAVRMEAVERTILRTLGYADPYAARTPKARRRP